MPFDKLRAHTRSGPELRLKAPSAKVSSMNSELRPFGSQAYRW